MKKLIEKERKIINNISTAFETKRNPPPRAAYETKITNFLFSSVVVNYTHVSTRTNSKALYKAARWAENSKNKMKMWVYVYILFEHMDKYNISRVLRSPATIEYVAKRTNKYVDKCAAIRIHHLQPWKHSSLVHISYTYLYRYICLTIFPRIAPGICLLYSKSHVIVHYSLL